MNLFLSRILMTAADGSPGGGQPPAPASPAPAPAQGPAALTRDDLKSFADDVRNGVFADLRRAGVLGKEPKPKKNDDDTPAPQGTPSTSAPDPMKLRELDRSLTRLGAADKLSDAAYKRMERAFVEEGPTDVASWAKDYLGGFGFAPPATPASGGQAPTTMNQDPNKPLASNAGGVPAPNVPLEERSLIGMSESDVNHLVKTKGATWVRRRLYDQLRGVRVKIS